MRGDIFDTSREKTPGGVSHCLLFSAQPSPSWPAFHFPYGSEPASSSKREIREPLEQTPELPGHGSLGRSLGKAGQRSDGLCCFGKQPRQRACGDGAEHHKGTRRVPGGYACHSQNPGPQGTGTQKTLTVLTSHSAGHSSHRALTKVVTELHPNHVPAS